MVVTIKGREKIGEYMGLPKYRNHSKTFVNVDPATAFNSYKEELKNQGVPNIKLYTVYGIAS